METNSRMCPDKTRHFRHFRICLDKSRQCRDNYSKSWDQFKINLDNWDTSHSPRNENLNLLVRIYLKKILFEQSFTGLGPDDWWPSWGLISRTFVDFRQCLVIFKEDSQLSECRVLFQAIKEKKIGLFILIFTL